ncbi:PREDICTED: uncharacterized protein LOC104815425 [Tarenaya hassleriana]|uniref:uncharacterized protein LOC104815425 n=1 Tax=Tarenaya hassleriana TaxID=28532 RepID=UPI00053CA548|nr:PREDICTED: uncharacterized protein LOC104815425 [Tarenaya hassleriana]
MDSNSPPVFDGENYQMWAVKMKAYMKGADLWETVEEDYGVTPLGANPTLNQMKIYRDKVTRKGKAMSCLFASVPSFIFTKIMNMTNAKEMWDSLKEEYEGDEKIRGMKVLNLLREFERQQMKPNETVKVYVDRLINSVSKIRILGTEMTDEKIVQKVMVSVPERFEATLASLENTKELSQLKLLKFLVLCKRKSKEG